jgi:hypothetical protein
MFSGNAVFFATFAELKKTNKQKALQFTGHI